MAKLARNKKFLKLEDVRVSYRAHDDTIHLSSGDNDFPTGFHLPLSKGTAVEGKLRELLKDFNLIDTAQQDLHADLPLSAEIHEEYFTDPSVPPHFFPVGVGLKSDVIVNHPITGESTPLLGFNLSGRGSNGRDNESALAPHVLISGVTGGGKSIIERNVILGALMRPDHWKLLLIDLKIVEFSCWRNYKGVLSVVTSMEDALFALRYAQKVMMDRYEELENQGLNQYLDLPKKPKGIILMIDEIALLLAKQGIKTEQDKVHDAMAEEALDIIANIARLGRAAGVHLVLASQRPTDEILPGEVKANIDVRIQCGKTDKQMSLATLNNLEGTSVRSNPRGRIYVQIYGQGKHGQGLYVDPSWKKENLLWSNETNTSNAVGCDEHKSDDLWRLQEENES